MHEDLQRLQTEIAQALAGLDASQTQATPSGHPDKWSIQQIVEHLILTYRSTCPVLETRLEKRTATKASPMLRQRLAQWMILSLGRFPHGRVAPPPVDPTQPTPLRTGSELAGRVKDELNRMSDLLAQGDVLFGRQRAVSHMVLGPLSMDQWRTFHLVHGLHHLGQVRTIRRENRF